MEAGGGGDRPLRGGVGGPVRDHPQAVRRPGRAPDRAAQPDHVHQQPEPLDGEPLELRVLPHPVPAAHQPRPRRAGGQEPATDGRPGLQPRSAPGGRRRGRQHRRRGPRHARRPSQRAARRFDRRSDQEHPARRDQLPLVVTRVRGPGGQRLRRRLHRMGRRIAYRYGGQRLELPRRADREAQAGDHRSRGPVAGLQPHQGHRRRRPRVQRRLSAPGLAQQGLHGRRSPAHREAGALRGAGQHRQGHRGRRAVERVGEQPPQGAARAGAQVRQPAEDLQTRLAADGRPEGADRSRPEAPRRGDPARGEPGDRRRADRLPDRPAPGAEDRRRDRAGEVGGDGPEPRRGGLHQSAGRDQHPPPAARRAGPQAVGDRGRGTPAGQQRNEHPGGRPRAGAGEPVPPVAQEQPDHRPARRPAAGGRAGLPARFPRPLAEERRGAGAAARTAGAGGDPRRLRPRVALRLRQGVRVRLRLRLRPPPPDGGQGRQEGAAALGGEESGRAGSASSWRRTTSHAGWSPRPTGRCAPLSCCRRPRS